MSFRKINSRARRAMLGLAALAVVLVVVVVATSGGSASTTTSSPAAASASAGTSASRTAFAACMKEHGVTIAPHGAGNGGPANHSGPPPGGAGAGAGSGSSARQAAFKACGANGQHIKAP